MKLFFSSLTLSASICFSSSLIFTTNVHSQALDGFVSPAVFFVKQLGMPANGVNPTEFATATTDEQVARLRYAVSFARLQKGVQFDFDFGSGGGYSDLGAVFKVFHHFYMSENSSSGPSLGLGLGARFSSKGMFSVSDSTTAALRGFNEIVVSPFARYLWDSTKGWGISVDLGMEFMPRRGFSDDATPTSDSQLRKRFFAGATLLLSSRWLE